MISALASSSSGRRTRATVGLGLIVLLLAGLVASQFGLANFADWIRALTDWAKTAGPGGWAVFVAAQTLVAMAGIVPASLLGLAAGAVYGVFGGFALATVGTLLGGWLAFALARSLFRPVIARMIARRSNSRLVQLDAAVTRDGWRFVCLLRISPVMPFALTSYGLGLTQISSRAFMLGTFASLPALAGYVALGALATTSVLSAGGGAPRGPFGWALLVVGGAATLLLILRSGALLARCGLLPRALPGSRGLG